MTPCNVRLYNVAAFCVVEKWSLQKRMQQSRVVEEGMRWTSCAILAVVAWYGLQIAWGLLWFSLELGLLIVTWLLATAFLLLYSAIWVPNFYASCVYSLILGESSRQSSQGGH